MPTYEYICTECNYEFESFQSMSAAVLTECPTCKGKVRRKISAGLSPIFKGSGFYQTDYKDSKKPSAPASTPKKDTPAESAPAKPAADAPSSTSSSSTES
ncbi:MAG: hypothetical protein HYV28_08065 [Ignavibacteriales bacterium]|nr:hypothetical protein [Ignavibacteriales bacterium]